MDHHAPPMDLLFEIIQSMDSWLRADPLNVAVVHCLGGKIPRKIETEKFFTQTDLPQILEFLRQLRFGGSRIQFWHPLISDGNFVLAS